MESYTMLIENLRKNFKSGITKTKEYRLAQLKNLMKMYEEGESELIAALKEDLGKPTAEAMMYEVDFNKNFVKHTIAALGKSIFKTNGGLMNMLRKILLH